VNSLLTNIAGQFAKPLILAGVLPVVITVSLLLLVTHPRFPLPLTLPAAIKTVDASWQVTFATLLVLVIAMVLHVLNTPIVRLLSGYPWRRTAFGKALTRARQAEFRRLRTQRDGLVTLYRDLLPAAADQKTDAGKAEEAAAAGVNRALTPLSLKLNADFPYGDHLILPTRLGNVIRNFEDYSRELYGISTVRLWPRLVAVIDARYAALLDDAKTNFDFMVNCAVLFFLAALLTATVAWQAGISRPLLLDAVTRTLFFAGLSIFAYVAATERARSWGSLVKAAVDLYRRALLKQLDYSYTFADAADERQRFWTRLSSLWEFPDLRNFLEKVPFAQGAPVALTSASSANGVPLATARGVTTPAGKPYATMTVTLRVQNVGDKAANDLTVGDPIPPGWSFVWGSQRRVGAQLAPTLKSSVALVEVQTDALDAGASCEITYQLQSLVVAA
jgi:uncharacterized repeat protein (TIGR01451 family)